MGVAFNAAGVATTTSTSATTFTLLLAFAQSHGDMLVVGIKSSTAGAITNVQDSNGNNYSLIVGQANAAQNEYLYVANNLNAAAANTNTITVTFSTTGLAVIIQAADFNITGGVGTVDSFGSAGTTSTGVTTVASVTMVVGMFVGVTTTSNPTAGSGYTLAQASTAGAANSYMTEYMAVTTAGLVGVTENGFVTTTGDCTVCAVALTVLPSLGTNTGNPDIFSKVPKTVGPFRRFPAPKAYIFNVQPSVQEEQISRISLSLSYPRKKA